MLKFGKFCSNLLIMYKFIFSIFFCVLFSISTHAQTAPRYDTVMVAVYNTGAKYRAAPAEFGANPSTLFTKNKEFVGTLVAGNDTVHTWGVKNCDTCKTQKKQTTLTVSHGCNNVNGDIKDKIVILDLGSCKDATRMALSAQKLGAKAVIFTHYDDDRDKITLKKDGGDGKNSTRNLPVSVADSIKIPVFTVRNTTGAKMSAMLPSHIGIKEPKILPPDIQGLASAAQYSADSLALLNQPLNANIGNNEMKFAPNPTDDLVYLHYRFDTPQSVKINISNGGGKIIFSSKLEAPASEGEYEIDTTGWANGVYVATMQRAGVRLVTKKFVVNR